MEVRKHSGFSRVSESVGRESFVGTLLRLLHTFARQRHRVIVMILSFTDDLCLLIMQALHKPAHTSQNIIACVCWSNGTIQLRRDVTRHGKFSAGAAGVGHVTFDLPRLFF